MLFLLVKEYYQTVLAQHSFLFPTAEICRKGMGIGTFLFGFHSYFLLFTTFMALSTPCVAKS